MRKNEHTRIFKAMQGTSGYPNYSCVGAVTELTENINRAVIDKTWRCMWIGVREGVKFNVAEMTQNGARRNRPDLQFGEMGFPSEF